MNLNEAVKQTVHCAALYQQELENRSFLILFRDRTTGQADALEVFFYGRNFKHLTGLNSGLSPRSFYQRCLSHTLRPGDIQLKPDGTTVLKLRVLGGLLCPDLSARMAGDFNGRGPCLGTEYLSGTVKACIGFRTDESTGNLVPNTVLKADIRDVTRICHPVYAVFRKMNSENEYAERTYFNRKMEVPILSAAYTYLAGLFQTAEP